ncbi:MAG: type II secretion system F family protein [Kiritimatiellae bacterium]|nr:type II secretion system F family protein [Kiritimatiellia bacterium]
MTTWTYRGFRAEDGRRIAGRIEADSAKQARERLAARGILPAKVEPLAADARASHHWRRRDERAGVYRELAALLGAGLPMTAALEALIESPEWTAVAAALTGVRDRIREGAGAAEAFEASGVTVLESSLLHAGQRAGEIATTFTKLADLLDEESMIRDRVRSALLYPAMVSGVALFIAAGVFLFLLPAFARMFEESRVALPPLTRAVIAAGRFSTVGAVPAFLVLGGTVWWIRQRCRRSVGCRLAIERLMSRLPLMGPAREALVALRFARTLGLLLRGGIPMIEALGLAAAVCGSARVVAEMPAQVERVRHGGRLSEAIRSIEPLRRMLAAWVEAGEQSGDLPAMLEIAAARCEQAWHRRLSRGLTLIEPALILVLGSLVFLLALAILQPILALHRQIV